MADIFPRHLIGSSESSGQSACTNCTTAGDPPRRTWKPGVPGYPPGSPRKNTYPGNRGSRGYPELDSERELTFYGARHSSDGSTATRAAALAAALAAAAAAGRRRHTGWLRARRVQGGTPGAPFLIVRARPVAVRGSDYSYGSFSSFLAPRPAQLRRPSLARVGVWPRASPCARVTCS